MLLLFTLLSFYFTNKCWAQEPTSTITITEPTTTTSEFTVIQPTTIHPSADATTTYVDPEDSTTLPEPPSDPTTTTTDSTTTTGSTIDNISDSTTTTTPSETPVTTPMPTNVFTAFANPTVVRDCDELIVSWNGTGIESPYFVTWSTGSGEMGDTSILGSETFLGRVCKDHIRWQAPPASTTSHGNVLRFTIEDTNNNVATVWMDWEATEVQECPPFVSDGLDILCLMGPFSIPGLTSIPVGGASQGPTDPTGFPSAPSIPDNTGPSHPLMVLTPSLAQMTTMTFTVTVEPTPNSPQVAGIQLGPELLTLTLTVPADPTPTPTLPPSSPNATPTTVNVAVDGPSVVAVPIQGNDNSPTPARNNSPRPSAANSPLENSPQPSGYSESNSQGTNDDSDVYATPLLRTFVVPLGDSTTLTIVTEISQPAASTRDNFGVQQSVTPATTAVSGQKNDTRRTGLPPAATGVIVGSILGGLTLWALLVIWLKRRKRAAQRFNELEDPFSFSPTQGIRVTPFTAPTRPSSSVNTNPNPKQRMQEIIRSNSPVTSVGDTGTYSYFYNVPVSDTQSQELSCSAVGSSKPLNEPAKLFKSPRGSLI